MLIFLLACHPEPKTHPPVGTDTSTTDSSPTVVDSDSTTLPSCTETAGAALDEAQYRWMAWDDGSIRYSVADFSSYTGGDGQSYDISGTPGWEGVRFELDHPAVVYALKVAWAQLPESEAPVTISLFADLGQNGFDYDLDQTLWTGTRCLDASAAEDWVTYKLDTPLVVEGPALIYAASYRDGDNGPMLGMDGGSAGDGTCQAWDDCHSSIRYGTSARYYDTGDSFPLPYDFTVQLQYDYSYETPEADRWFHQDSAANMPASGNIAWGDYDDDGDDDIMLAGPSLFRNDDGVFVDVSVAAGVQVGIGTAGGVWGDYDNDGCLDYYGMNGSRSGDASGNELLLHSNCDGTFSDQTALSGIDDLEYDVDCLTEGTPQHSPTYGASWVDFDNDGLLDLAQANFLCFDDYTYYPDRFWHNDGGGIFSEWGTEHGFEYDFLAGRGVTALDADQDGDVDISINNYVLQKNLYYENQGDGQFLERGIDVGLDGDLSLGGYYGHTIGLAWGDLDGDGQWDQVAANLAHPRYYTFSDKTQLLFKEGDQWVNHASERGILYRETHSNPSLFDFENDGDLDLIITEVYDGRPTDIYENDGSGQFTIRREEAGILTENGWGSAVSDYDNDGDADLMVSNLYRNDHATGHYLKLRLVGDVATNWAAIGATAYVTAGGQTRMAFVSGGNGVGNQDSQTLLFGLGTATTIDSVEISFPGGGSVSYTGLQIDHAYRLYESGSVVEGLSGR